MLTALKLLLRTLLFPGVYITNLVVIVLTIFKRAEWGFFLLVVMIPQPNILYKLHDYPLGKDFIDLLFFAILFGIIIQKKGFAGNLNSIILLIFIVVNYVSLWNSSFRFSLPLPISSSNPLVLDWKNYTVMIFLYFLAMNVAKDEKTHKTIVVLMSAVILMISIRSYRNFYGGATYIMDKRIGGPFEAVGLGANHFGAFIADYCIAFLGLAICDKHKWRRLLFLATALMGLHPLFYSYSRGAYIAAFSGLVFLGLLKKRSLLILVAVVLISWQMLLPSSVVDRINMTETQEGELDNSAGQRLVLWEHAMDLFKSNMVFGVGFGGFGFTVSEGELTDTHNLYLKILSEQGVIGFSLLALIMTKAFLSGWRLYRIGHKQFYNGLGLALMGTVVSLMVTNVFGDRWSYFILGSYFWILWGLVDRSIIMAKDQEKECAGAQGTAALAHTV